jgi:hypothetical protein
MMPIRKPTASTLDEIAYQFSLNFDVQRQYAKLMPRTKSVRDAKENVKEVVHCPSLVISIDSGFRTKLNAVKVNLPETNSTLVVTESY